METLVIIFIVLLIEHCGKQWLRCTGASTPKSTGKFEPVAREINITRAVCVVGRVA